MKKERRPTDDLQPGEFDHETSPVLGKNSNLATQNFGKIPRFRVIDPSGRTETSAYDTISEVVKDLQSNKRDMSLQQYYVECLIDDIQIPAEDLLEAWEEGERPEDLQMF